MDNLFNLENFEYEDILKIIKMANDFKKKDFSYDFNYEKIVGLLFFEPSTRTHYSFEVAAKKLKLDVINFSPVSSALEKGESFVDTIKTFESFGIDAMVIRDEKDKYYEKILDVKTPIINGGDGSGSHPTQSLLDLFTIYEEFKKFDGLNVLIIGDIKHSRVARTNYNIMTKLGINVEFVADKKLQDNYGKYVNLDEGLKKADVVMLLRVQLERHSINYKIEEYNKLYGLNKKRLEMIKKNCIIMHPAPFNMNVELTQDVIDDKRCKIFEQSKNGVFIRMAVLYEILK